MELTLQSDPVKSKLPPPRVPNDQQRAQVAEWRAEIDAFYDTMQEFGRQDVGEILMNLSSFSARMSQIRTQIVRSENKLTNNFRTKEIDPFIQECDRQYKIWSRQQAIRQFDFDLTKGI